MANIYEFLNDDERIVIEQDSILRATEDFLRQKDAIDGDYVICGDTEDGPVYAVQIGKGDDQVTYAIGIVDGTSRGIIVYTAEEWALLIPIIAAALCSVIYALKKKE